MITTPKKQYPTTDKFGKIVRGPHLGTKVKLVVTTDYGDGCRFYTVAFIRSTRVVTKGDEIDMHPGEIQWIN